MTVKEFKKLKVGDKVRIITKVPSGICSDAWNNMGGMDKWLGKIMTIRGFTRTGIARMVEDKTEYNGNGWFWYPEVIAYKVDDHQPVIVEHLIKDRKTIVKLSNGRVGIAQRSPEDKFDIYEGLRIAAARAYEKGSDEIFGEEEPKVREVGRVAKVGEYIKIVKPTLAAGLYNAGDVLQVSEVSDRTKGAVYSKDIYSPYFERHPIWKCEYVVLEGCRPKKK